jgi:hypothetical protein
MLHRAILAYIILVSTGIATGCAEEKSATACEKLCDKGYECRPADYPLLDTQVCVDSCEVAVDQMTLCQKECDTILVCDIWAVCIKQCRSPEKICEEHCDKGIACLPNEIMADNRQPCIDNCLTGGTDLLACRVACNNDSACEGWLGCLDVCEEEEGGGDNGGPDAGASDGGALPEPCDGYVKTGDQDDLDCCRVGDPCGWDDEGLGYCDCQEACPWDKDDCEGV